MPNRLAGILLIGAVIGWVVPRLMGSEAYGVPADLGVAVFGALTGGLISNVAIGGWVAGGIAAILCASAAVVALRQVKTLRDRQQMALASARVASRRRAPGGTRP